MTSLWTSHIFSGSERRSLKDAALELREIASRHDESAARLHDIAALLARMAADDIRREAEMVSDLASRHMPRPDLEDEIVWES